jgi:hypothetical protein
MRGTSAPRIQRDQVFKFGLVIWTPITKMNRMHLGLAGQPGKENTFPAMPHAFHLLRSYLWVQEAVLGG